MAGKSRRSYSRADEASRTERARVAAIWRLACRASTLENEAWLVDRRYIGEPKFDGQRAQIHILEGRTVACYSRPGADLLAIRAWRGSGRSPGSR